MKRDELPRELQTRANQYAQKNGYLKADLLQSINGTHFFSGVYSNDEPPLPVGLPFIFLIKGAKIQSLPPFADLSTYA